MTVVTVVTVVTEITVVTVVISRKRSNKVEQKI